MGERTGQRSRPATRRVALPAKRIEERLRDIIIALYLAIEAERMRNERFRQQRAHREAEVEPSPETRRELAA
jgi:hypothetical protein